MDIVPCSPTFISQQPQQSHTDRTNRMRPPTGLQPKASMTTRPGAIQPCTPCFRPQQVKTKSKGTKPAPSKPKSQAQPMARAPITWKRTVPVPKASSSRMRTEEVTVDGSDDSQCWIARSLSLPAERRNGWVISWIIETHFNESVVVQACEKEPFNQRMDAAGLGITAERSV